MDLPTELIGRGLVQHSSAPIEKIFEGKRTVYIGVDPTADSLHVGHLTWVLLMKRLGNAGHKLIFLVGGGTGMIGDPKEKGERVLLDDRTVAANTRALKAQLKRVMGGTPFRMVDNGDWLLKEKLVPFLRDVGKHFTVNDLIKRDLIKNRLADPNDSISYTEFTYALLQGYDYYVLNQKYGCDLQIGASDQWTNILSGTDLIRKRTSKEAFAFTFPLMVDSSGKKFGKSEGNAVWLDGGKTSPLAFYQFWLNSSDESVENYLKVFTFMPLPEIAALMELHKRNPERRQAQKMLARQVTELVHGKSETERAERFSDVLFGSASLDTLSESERRVLADSAPSIRLKRMELESGYPLVEALVANGFVSSKAEARRLIGANGIRVNGELATLDRVLRLEDLEKGFATIQKGKSERLLVFVS